jgi:formate dehydrogenase subunit delta
VSGAKESPDVSAAKESAVVSGPKQKGTAMGDAGGLVRMLNQIAANAAHHPPDEAVAEIAAHLRATWAPAMCAELDAYLDRGGLGLTSLAAAAAERLRAEMTRSSPA